MTTLHVPLRPSWACAVCYQSWPCLSRRRQLIAEYDRAPASLSLLMSSYVVEAADDLHDAPAGTLHNRFLGWLSRPSERCER
ncbi:flavin reductase [Planosporangium thailandense]|uniref:Flavin reductase n=1 Tax=Planosporangium thailandense TaxID=765197 RepID=A0ABX0Y207_9ACTN|nr:flavin reductase [Planosporangium thailandense]